MGERLTYRDRIVPDMIPRIKPQPMLPNRNAQRMNETGNLGVIFDMDGVLVDSAEPHLRSWRLLAGENGIEVTDEQFATTFGRQNDDIIPILFGDVDEARLIALANRKEALYRDLVRNLTPIVDGAVELVRDLRRFGARLAIGSSGPRANIDLVLSAMGVIDDFDVVVSADDVTRGKPDPQVFQIACEWLALSPGRCVVIEDAPVGVTAAKAAGAWCVAVMMHHPRDAFAHADHVVASLGELSVTDVTALVSP